MAVMHRASALGYAQIGFRGLLPAGLVLLGGGLWLIGPIGRLLVSGAMVLFAPGALIWALIGRDLRLPRLSAPAMWLGLSLSVIPLVFLWCSALGLRLTPRVLQLMIVGVALLALWIGLRRPEGGRGPRWLIAAWSTVLGLTALTRVLEIRGIAAPLWVDSIHHTLLVRIVGETGQIPTSLQPYLPVDHLLYHWGYHVVTATWRAVADLPLIEAVLWSGQVLNAAIALVLYALGAYTLRSPRAGLIAAGTGGLLSLLPAYYVTWGRYTQLTGLLLLAPLLIASMALAERPRYSWRLVLLTGLLVAGLLVVHYRVLIFYAAFMLPYVVLLALRRPRSIGGVALRLATAALLGLGLAAPWSYALIRQFVLPVAAAPEALVGNDTYNSIDPVLLFAGNARMLYIVAAIGALVAIRRWRVLAIAAWIGMLFAIANPTVVGLPPSWLINNHAVIITLFMPVVVLVAAGISVVLRWIERRLPRRVRMIETVVVAALGLALACVGTWQLRSVINTGTILAERDDLIAIEWVARNTPPESRFLINTTYWLNGSYRATDGGWWLLPLAGRWVSTPPALYIYGDPSYKQSVEAYNQRVSALQPADREQLLALIREQHITHIFIGKHQNGSLRADVLFSDPALIPVYDEGGVTIFAVRNSF